MLTPDEVRMLDNELAILFIRGERPIMDKKYDIMKHPNVGMTPDSGESTKEFHHGTIHNAVANITLSNAISETQELLSEEEYVFIFDENEI